MSYRIDNPKEVIRQIQRYLLAVAYSDTQIPKVTLSGEYTPTTREAVRAFQKSKGLDVTGTVNYATWTALYDAFLVTQREEAVFLEDEWFDMHLGDTGSGVVVLQSRLGDLSRVYPAITRPAITGQFGLATAEAVRAVQRSYGDYADGIVTRALWNQMDRDVQAREVYHRYSHIF